MHSTHGFWRLALLLLGVLAALPGWTQRSWAHSSSNSYLTVDAAGRTLHVQWSIALRDLDYAVGVDATGDGTITWGALRARAPAIDAYVLPRLSFTADGAACDNGSVAHLADRLSDGAYAVLRFDAVCPAAPRTLAVRYRLLFDLDPQHRGLLRLTLDGGVHAVALSPAQPTASFDANPSFAASFRTFFLAGVEHLLTGIDHLLFVSMLLVPAMFRRRPSPTGSLARWDAVPRFAPAFIEAAKVLSAFTVAHALTLSSAVLGYIHAPAQAIEAGIALTILVTAVDNFWHVLPGPRWLLAFCFGLIHGFGFANALGPLDLPPVTLAAALLAFNLGLEAAQIGVAALVLPVGFLVRHTTAYRQRFLPGVSGAVALLALAWFTDRAAGWQLMPF
jgi:HupE / UreJ protein